MKRIALASLLGGLTTFFMGFILWVALPIHMAATQEFRSEKGQDSQLSSWFQALEQGEGTYFVPQFHYDDSMSKEQMTAAEEEKMDAAEKGPYAVIHLWPQGKDLRDSMMLVKGLLLSILGAFLVSSLLSMARPGMTYMQRVLFVAATGCFVAVVGPMTSINFALVPLEWGMVLVFDHVLTWLVSGLVIAKVIRS